jgi:hypothetical protein
MEEHDSLTSFGSILKGFLSGSLMAGGIANQQLGIGLQALLFLVGLAVFLDEIIPSSRNIHIITAVAFMFFGAIVSFVMSLGSGAQAFLLVVFIITIVVYLERIILGLNVLKK